MKTLLTSISILCILITSCSSTRSFETIDSIGSFDNKTYISGDYYYRYKTDRSFAENKETFQKQLGDHWVAFEDKNPSSSLKHSINGVVLKGGCVFISSKNRKKRITILQSRNIAEAMDNFSIVPRLD